MRRRILRKAWIGIDNGVSGSVGTIGHLAATFFPTPVFKEQDYTKKKKNISRIAYPELFDLLEETKAQHPDGQFALIERPMINGARFNASISASRALECTLIILDELGIGKQFVDSKEWQKALLPKGCEGPELKTASLDIGTRLFPQFKEAFVKQKDADGMLIAEYCRRTYGSEA